MGIISKLRAQKSAVETGVGEKRVSAGRTEEIIRRCADAYAGVPDWAGTDGVRTVNFARTVCSETARLAMLGAKVTLEGGARAKFLGGQTAAVMAGMRRAVEYACANGTVILKPNGHGVDTVLPGSFTVTDSDGGEITGVVFRDARRGADGKLYVRSEYHRFEGDEYVVSNRVVRDGRDSVPLASSPWAGLSRDVRLTGVERPLFGVIRMPAANNVDVTSPLGMPLIADALSELRDLDVAYSRFAKEISDSRRTVLLDSDRLLPFSGVRDAVRGFRAAADNMGLPDYVKMVYGTGAGDVYHEINPTLHTSERLEGINALLFQIGNKCGFSGGYFTAGERRGVVTATEVEADDRRTIEMIRDVRDCVQRALDGVIYALDKLCDLYGTAPAGDFEVIYDFGDITYNPEEDRRRWFEYVEAGIVPAEYFLRRFEGTVLPEASQQSFAGDRAVYRGTITDPQNSGQRMASPQERLPKASQQSDGERK